MSLLNEIQIRAEELLGGHRTEILGRKLIFHPYDRQLWIRLSDGRWEPKTLQWLRENLSKNSVFLDVGSWIGPTTIYAHLCGARVVAIEPDPIAYERLLYNINRNDLREITTVHGGLTNKNGTFQISCARGLGKSMSKMNFSGADSLPTEKNTMAQAAGFDLDTIFQISGIQNVDILKMDIEGGEFFVFPEVAKALAGKVKKVMLSLHGKLFSDSDFASLAPRLIAATDAFPQKFDLHGKPWVWDEDRKKELRTKYTEIILS